MSGIEGSHLAETDFIYTGLWCNCIYPGVSPEILHSGDLPPPKFHLTSAPPPRLDGALFSSDLSYVVPSIEPCFGGSVNRTKGALTSHVRSQLMKVPSRTKAKYELSRRSPTCRWCRLCRRFGRPCRSCWSVSDVLFHFEE